MKGKNILILAVFGFIVFFAIEAQATDWKYYCTDAKGGDHFYDTQRISRGQDTVKVWTKNVLSEDAKKAILKKFPNPTDIEKISYIVKRDEVNCSRNTYRILSTVVYNSGGGVFSSSDTPDDSFQEVVPGSTLATLVEILCKKGEDTK